MSTYHTPRSEPNSPRRPRESYHSPRRYPPSSQPPSVDANRPRRSSVTDGDYPRASGERRHTRTQSSQKYPHHSHHKPRASHGEQLTPSTPTRKEAQSYVQSTPTPPRHYSPREPMLEPGPGIDGIVRKKSLVRPERRQRNPGDPDYHYRKHAQNMDIMPSTTGVDPQMEDAYESASSQATTMNQYGPPQAFTDDQQTNAPLNRAPSKKEANKLRRKATELRDQEVKEKQRERIREAAGTPTLWGTYCHLVTFWCPDAILDCLGKKQRAQRRAWREKMGLLSIIGLFMLFVGFLTFGFTEATCPNGGPLRLRINHVDSGYMIFHGSAYNLEHSHHPAAMGITAGANVLWDLATPHGGQDCSFLFQNVNGACKGLITRSAHSDVPTNSDDDLAWYFPCNCYNQDGSTKPNLTIPYYLGYACHTAKPAREDFYGLRSSGDVYFKWDDVRNKSRNLMVYNGDVLDLDLLQWFNKSEVAYPAAFDEIRQNPAVQGVDVTLAFAAGEKKQIAQCFQEIIKVGSIDTATVGCIASKVVLYVSLVFILSIVVTKFVLAVLYQWFFCRRYAAPKTTMTSNIKKRNQQIEDWSNDIYRPPPKMADPVSIDGPNRGRRRTSFLPTTSRFTSPYEIERSMTKHQRPMTTMGSQQMRSSVASPGSGTGFGSTKDSNMSQTTLTRYMDSPRKPTFTASSVPDSYNTESSQRYNSTVNTDTDTAGPQGFIHEAVVPQPPSEWQPFGFPLAHAICFVTAYSEGPEGLRTTLDSIATTDYPNSHKLMFVVCDGLIQGKGEKMSTPDACLSMMKDHAVLPDEVQAFSYVAVASGSKRHNMAKIYSGFYDYGRDSIVPLEKQQRVPMILVVKCGTPAEATASKPGNRGKRDSQIVLMSFLQKVMFDERMTELEYEMFNGIWKITGISPDFYEIVLMVDADTKVFPDSMTHMVSTMVKDPEIMGLCGETKIANKTASWVSMIQVFEYFISHHLAKSFESCFGGVTCLPGCFCMYRVKAPKGAQNYWVPILANPDVVEHYSENVVETLHKKNLLLLGEDRYLSSLMLRTFPKRKQVFVPQAVCKTTVPDDFKVLLSQRRRWINSTIHNLMELVLVRDLCGTFCFSMQFVVFIDLVGCIVLPAAICFTIYVCALGIKAAITHTVAPVIPLVLLALILGLPGVLIIITAHRWSYVIWMLVYLLSLPIWNLVLPAYAYWHFDDFSWGDTRLAAGETKGAGKDGHGGDGEFDSSQITMKRWGDFEQERRLRAPTWSAGYGSPYGSQSGYGSSPVGSENRVYRKHEPVPSNLAYEEHYSDYP